MRVHKECELSSQLLDVQLRRGARLRVLKTQKIPEQGLKRALVVLLAESVPLGWMTISCEKGECATVRPIYARPLYVVVASPLVRKRFERSSRAVCMLPVGTKLHLVDSRRDTDGGQRVCIVLLGQEEPLGWITAKRQQTGWISIREVADDDPLLFSPGASPPSSRPPSARGSARGRSKSPRDFGRWFPSSPREQGHANFALAIAAARAKKGYVQLSPNASPTSTPRSHRSPTTSPKASPRPSIFNREQILKVRSAATAAAAAGDEEGEPEAEKSGGASSAPTSARERASPSTSSGGGNPSGGGNSERERRPSSPAPDSGKRRAKRSTDDANAPILPSTTLAAAVKECQDKTATEEAKLDPSKKTIPVLLGESLLESKLKVGELVQTWAKRGNEPLNKMEFRQHIRKLVEKADSKKIDALFESLDDDGGGTLDLVEIRAALKKLQDAAGAMAKVAATIREKIDRIKHLETLAQQAFDATTAMEEATAEIERLSSNKSVSARLGAQIVSKRLKVADVIQKWDANGDGELDKVEFRQNVKAIGVQADSPEIDELFDQLNTDGGESLSISEVKAALKILTDEALGIDKSLKDVKRSLVDLSRAARSAQVAYRRQHKEFEALEAAEAEIAAREAEEKAAAAAEAKAVRVAAMAEKKKAAAAAKADFEAKVAAKRGLWEG